MYSFDTLSEDYLCNLRRSEVYRRYSDTLRPVMSTKMSPVTTFIRGGRPPTPLGQEKPVPCMEQIQRTGSRMVKGSVGGDVAISVGAQQGEETYQMSGRIHITQLHGKSQHTGCSRIIYIMQENTFSILALVSKCAAQELFSAFPNIIYKVHTFQNQLLFFIFLHLLAASECYFYFFSFLLWS